MPIRRGGKKTGPVDVASGPSADAPEGVPFLLGNAWAGSSSRRWSPDAFYLVCAAGNLFAQKRRRRRDVRARMRSLASSSRCACVRRFKLQGCAGVADAERRRCDTSRTSAGNGCLSVRRGLLLFQCAPRKTWRLLQLAAPHTVQPSPVLYLTYCAFTPRIILECASKVGHRRCGEIMSCCEVCDWITTPCIQDAMTAKAL